jgi:hypothetical protein
LVAINKPHRLPKIAAVSPSLSSSASSSVDDASCSESDDLSSPLRQSGLAFCQYIHRNFCRSHKFTYIPFSLTTPVSEHLCLTLLLSCNQVVHVPFILNCFYQIMGLMNIGRSSLARKYVETRSIGVGGTDDELGGSRDESVGQWVSKETGEFVPGLSLESFRSIVQESGTFPFFYFYFCIFA